jgi:hypothetical protein
MLGDLHGLTRGTRHEMDWTIKKVMENLEGNFLERGVSKKDFKIAFMEALLRNLVLAEINSQMKFILELDDREE